MALTEARIVAVTCGGLTVVQTGLPPNAAFEVAAIDGRNGEVLVEREVRSSTSGRLRVRLLTDLHGIHRLHAEVERSHVANSEYGEADVDLNRHCTVVGTKPVSEARPSAAASRQSPTTPTPTPLAVERADAGDGWPWQATAAVAGGVAVVVGAGAWWVRRRGRTGS